MGDSRTEFPDAVIAEEQGINSAIEPTSIERRKAWQGREQAAVAIGGVLPDQVGRAADTALARRTAEFGMGD